MKKIEINKKISLTNTSLLNFKSNINFEDFNIYLINTIDNIIETKNPRIIVLETWLLLDFTIRNLIIWGINLETKSNEKFDLKNELLPVGFPNCIKFLINLRNSQCKLNINPNKDNLSLPFHFWYFVHKELTTKDREIVLRTIDSYNKKMNPDYLPPKKEIDLFLKSYTTVKENPIKKNITYRTVDENWIELTSKIDEKWEIKVRRINKARNIAAHSYNDNELFSVLGVNGDNKIKKLKSECLNSLEVLLQIELNI